MVSRVAGRMSIPDDKSAQEEYCTNEVVHDPSVSAGHTVVSPPSVEPELHPSLVQKAKTSKDMKSFNAHIPSRIISFCGGGHLGITHIGILKALRERSLLKYVKGVVGISAGALIALMYVLGYTIEDMEKLCQNMDLSMFTDIESEYAMLFYQTLCVNSGKMLDIYLKSLLENQGLSARTTFLELKKKRPSTFFRCYATRMQTSDIQEFSAERTPNHSILFATRASMCLPIIFAPMKDPFTDILYYDAGLIHNMPFAFLTEGEKRNSLCIHFDIFNDTPMEGDIFTIFKYAIKSIITQRNIHYFKQYGDNIIKVPVNFMNFLNSNTKEIKDMLIETGYRYMIAFLDTPVKTQCVRRYSVC